MKKIKTTVTYRVPDGHYCNLVRPGTLTQLTTHLCRFAVKDKHGYRCTLYNEPLDMSNDKEPLKARACVRAMCGFKSDVEDVADPVDQPIVDPRAFIKATLIEYNKMVRNLKSQGYPAELAEKVAKEYMTGGK